MIPFIVAAAATVLSGTPATSITAAHYYAFQPGVTGGSRTLTFSIANKPAWAQFDSGSGRLSGTPLPQTNVGTYSNILISASDGTARAYLAPFSITVAALPSTPPRIGGSPAAVVTAGHAYSFQPAATDPNGLRLVFAITGKPVWASFNAATGALTGTPTVANTGTYSNISITAYDGYQKSVLPAFAIVVQGTSGSTSPGQQATASATLSWQPPTQNTNGSLLTNLAGYRIYYGTAPDNLAQRVTVANPGVTRYAMSGLSAATWYFQMTAYDKNGIESPPTPVEKLITQ